MRACRQLVDGAQLDDAAVAHLAFALAVTENFSRFGCVFAWRRAFRCSTFDTGCAVKGEEFFRTQLLLVVLGQSRRCSQCQQAD